MEENKQHSSKQRKEYRDNNPEKIKEQKHNDYEKHKDKRDEKNKQNREKFKLEDPKGYKDYRHNEYMKKQQENIQKNTERRNKKIEEDPNYRKKKVRCSCGGIFLKEGQARHFDDSETHKLWQLNNPDKKVILTDIETNYNKYAVIQYDLEMNEINHFNSPKKAADELNIKKENIIKCCIGHQKSTSSGYTFRYVENVNVENKTFKTKCSCGEVFNNTGLNRHNKSKKHIEWMNNNPGKEPVLTLPTEKKIIQYDLNQKEIKTFDNVEKASRELDIPKGYINRVLTGVKKSTGGFIFKYLETN